MADPICRWRNSSIKQLIEFNSIFPLLPTDKSQGRDYVEKNWKLFGGNNFFTTPYQLAAQMGVYYENESFMFPRFHKLITIDEASLYLQYWGKNYYAPNPYTKSIQQEKSVVINKFLVNWAKDKGITASFSEALNEMFSSEIGNTDILINMLNNFSEVQIKDDIVSLKDASTARYADSDVWLEVDQNDKEEFFRFVCKDKFVCHKISDTLQKPLQQIYYGAPGTGKSYIVNRDTKGESVVRTTFHPDSDYSTFVGCYKPTTKKVAMRDVTGKIIVENDGTQVTEDRIVYEFVDQAFLQAYIKAWKFYTEAAEGAEPKKQYLIIEEINRGNCAQIFGDLFQLLDRNGCGFSDYYIHADKDMQKHLSKAFNNIDIDESHRNAINSLYPKDGDVVAKVLSGEILLIPDNLYIWATMNTSDQSLFPIDSAFKRRWDWRFRPIVKGRDNSGKELDWKIKVGQKVCAWWNFLEKINAVIGTMTSSADKKLGFFFCKAENGIISAETFVSKVIFYLWNDVFKDYGFEGSIFSDSEGTLDFDKFYGIDVDGEVVVQNDKIELFLTNLGLTLVDVDSVNENINNEGEVAENDGTSFEVVLDGERISEKTAIGKFLKVIEMVGIEKVAQLGLQVSGNPIISRDKLAEDTPGGYGGSQKYINGYWFVTKFNNPTKRKFLMEIKEKLGVNIVVE